MNCCSMCLDDYSACGWANDHCCAIHFTNTYQRVLQPENFCITVILALKVLPSVRSKMPKDWAIPITMGKCGIVYQALRSRLSLFQPTCNLVCIAHSFDVISLSHTHMHAHYRRENLTWQFKLHCEANSFSYWIEFVIHMLNWVAFKL